MKVKTKKTLKFTLIFSLLLILLSNIWVSRVSKNRVFNDINEMPENFVGMVLGTSKLTKNGNPNQYFFHRIEAAVELFKADKIKIIVVSGDNSTHSYNEPKDMRDELIKRGIPKEKIYLDYAGFRTFDSVFRLRDIFQQKKATVISQEFHNKRAIFIGNKLGMDLIGYNAVDVNKKNGLITNSREKLARVKMVIDILISKKPKFLGEPIHLSSNNGNN